MVSVIVPTRNEADSVPALVARLAGAMAPDDWEAVFVDDSDDETPRVVAGLADPRVRLLHRPPGRREGGLAGAVVEGLAATADSDMLAVLDGDLQHDPAVLPDLLAALDQAEVAIASRFVPGGGGRAGLDGWRRTTLSWLSRLAARATFPRLRRIADPLAGYFVLRRSVIEGAGLRPVGFKILLEILVRGRWQTVRELPYAMSPRGGGRSKATLSEGLRFGRHLARLRLANWGRGVGRAGRFGVVSVATMGLTQAVLAGLQAVGLGAVVANGVAVTLAALVGFVLSRRWVWPAAIRQSWARQVLAFWASAVGGLALSTLAASVLVAPDAPAAHANAVNLSAFAALWLARFLLLDSVVFNGVDSRSKTPSGTHVATMTWANPSQT